MRVLTKHRAFKSVVHPLGAKGVLDRSEESGVQRRVDDPSSAPPVGLHFGFLDRPTRSLSNSANLPLATDPASYRNLLLMDHARPANHSPDVWLTAAECAKQTQLTVRALRVYERYGLITPRRTEKKWRLYGVCEIERLNEIIILKQLGLPLSRIAQLLAKKPVDLAGILSLQATWLAGQRERLDRGLAMIAGLRAKIEGSGSLSLDELIRLAQKNTISQCTEDAIAWKLYEQARPRTAVRLAPALLRDYAGPYRVGRGALQGSIIGIEPTGRILELQCAGWPAIELVPEEKDKFFSKQMPFQIVFEREKTGQVCGLVLHQFGSEEPARRISQQEADASAKALAARIVHKTPFPNSEALVRKLIADAGDGTVDDTALSPQLAQVLRDQARGMKKEQAQLGRLKHLAFRGVGQDGSDVYDVVFQRGQQQWRLHLRADGKIDMVIAMPNP